MPPLAWLRGRVVSCAPPTIRRRILVFAAQGYVEDPICIVQGLNTVPHSKYLC